MLAEEMSEGNRPRQWEPVNFAELDELIADPEVSMPERELLRLVRSQLEQLVVTEGLYIDVQPTGNEREVIVGLHLMFWPRDIQAGRTLRLDVTKGAERWVRGTLSRVAPYCCGSDRCYPALSEHAVWRVFGHKEGRL